MVPALIDSSVGESHRHHRHRQGRTDEEEHDPDAAPATDHGSLTSFGAVPLVPRHQPRGVDTGRHGQAGVVASVPGGRLRATAQGEQRNGANQVAAGVDDLDALRRTRWWSGH